MNASPSGRSPAPPGRPRRSLLLAAALVLAGLAGCGSGLKSGQPASGIAAIDPVSARPAATCAPTVLETLAGVLARVYHEGVRSERTASAQYMITHSAALREAVEAGNAPAARLAAKALLATGHMTNIRITRAAKTLIDVGGAAMAPLHGTLPDAQGAPLASYDTSVWADEGFLIEGGGITQGLVALRAGQTWMTAAGENPSALPSGLGKQGTTVLGRVRYQYTSLAAEAYPSGPLRIYLFMPADTIASLCGHTDEDTTVKTLERVARLIYTGESGNSAHRQVLRVQRNAALLRAVADRDPVATEAAIKALLNHHIVRLRVSAGGRLLSDVGGPYVLAPVTAALRLHGHTIGSFVLSVQDDEGYLRLARRLAGLHVLMYMGADRELVKNSLGPLPGYVPANGAYRYRGHDYRVFTVAATAFPSGPLTIRVLVPIPYP